MLQITENVMRDTLREILAPYFVCIAYGQGAVRAYTADGGYLDVLLQLHLKSRQRVTAGEAANALNDAHLNALKLSFKNKSSMDFLEFFYVEILGAENNEVLFMNNVLVLDYLHLTQSNSAEEVITYLSHHVSLNAEEVAGILLTFARSAEALNK